MVENDYFLPFRSSRTADENERWISRRGEYWLTVWSSSPDVIGVAKVRKKTTINGRATFVVYRSKKRIKLITRNVLEGLKGKYLLSRTDLFSLNDLVCRYTGVSNF